MSDIRTVLESAFEHEPPLGIDSDSVVRKGRRSVKARQAASVAAVLAVVGAVYVSTTVATPGTRQAGASPTVRPATTEVMSTVGTHLVKIPKPLTEQHAAELTDIVRSAGVWPAGDWKFRADTSFGWYYLGLGDTGSGARNEDVVRISSPYGNNGEVQDRWWCEPKVGITCDTIQYNGKSVRVRYGNTYLVPESSVKYKSINVHVVAPDGAQVEVSSLAQVGEPLFTVEQLAKIATLPGLVY